MVYLPPELMNEIFLFHNPYLVLEKKINKIHTDLDEKGLMLNTSGVFMKGSLYFNTDPMKYPITPNNYKNISQCVDEIGNVFIPRKVATVGSYGGKHDIENYRAVCKGDHYISNGEFIMAMLLLGFKIKKNHGGPNCEFYASKIKHKILRKT